MSGNRISGPATWIPIFLLVWLLLSESVADLFLVIWLNGELKEKRFSVKFGFLFSKLVEVWEGIILRIMMMMWLWLKSNCCWVCLDVQKNAFIAFLNKQRRRGCTLLSVVWMYAELNVPNDLVCSSYHTLLIGGTNDVRVAREDYWKFFSIFGMLEWPLFLIKGRVSIKWERRKCSWSFESTERLYIYVQNEIAIKGPKEKKKVLLSNFAPGKRFEAIAILVGVKQ